MSSVNQLFYLLRFSQWSKSAFVLLGVIYSKTFTCFFSALLAAFSFCLVSSAVYIYNDIHDCEEDRLHPHKSKRPIANRTVSLLFATSLLIILLVFGLLLALTISDSLLYILASYLVVNLFYNHLLKYILVLDVICIASGFMLRILAGTIGIGLPISWWLTLSATLISLFIALCKRRLEKKLGLTIETRAVLKKYSTQLLDGLIIFTGFASFGAYLLYVIFVHQSSFYFLLTLPFAAIGIGRFIWFTQRLFKFDDPIMLLLNDNLSRFNLFCFITLTFLGLNQ